MKKVFLLFILFCCLGTSFAQNQNTLDSLFTELKKWENKSGIEADTNVYNCYYNIGVEFQSSNPDTAIYFLNKSMEKARKIKDKIREAENIKQQGWCYYVKGDYTEALKKYEQSINTLPENVNDKDIIRKQKVYAANLGNIGLVYADQGNYSKALEYYFKAQKIDEEILMPDGQIGDKKGQAGNLGNIGIVYHAQGNYSKALEYYFKALKICEEIGDKRNLAAILGNIGIVYKEQGYYSKALEYYFKALKINEEIGNKQYQAINLGNIGGVYMEQGNYSKALEYYFKALKIFEEIGNKQYQALNLVNIGVVYMEQAYYSKALEYYFKALKICEEIGDKQSQAINLGNIGALYIQQKKYKEAEEYLKQAILIGEELHIIYYLKEFYYSLSELYAQTGRYKDAFEAYKKHDMYKDSVNSEENQKALATKEMQYLFEKKQAEEEAKHEQELLRREAKEKQQRLYLYLALAIAGAILVILGIVYKSLQTTKRQKKIIEQTRDEIAAQKKIVEEKNKDILDSISYAKRIQEAILPNSHKWKQLLPQSIILYLPKDIVAGDFYWLEETDKYIFVAAADCTGHGVPGAMVSVVCSNALTRAVLEEKLTETNQILDRVREIVIEKLSGSDENIRDGMDVCLVRINKQNRKQIQYSGANRPLYIVENNTLNEIKPDKQPIGKYEETKPFTAQLIELNENTCLYLTTDGYADQFGGEKGKKIGTKPFKEMLSQTIALTLEEKGKELKAFFEQWKGHTEQMDDVTLLGIKI
ncbi:MAG: tetratricopeptide repeat protein [Bacteroidia bacterium]